VFNLRLPVRFSRLPSPIAARSRRSGHVGPRPLELKMPNHLQFLFLASFLTTFAVLLALSSYLSTKLRQAGYDISRLILIGLPQSENAHPIPDKMSAPTPSFLQLVALLVAAVSSAFIYLKFGRSGTLSFLTFFRHPLTQSPV
jgi:hypothetical protein